MKFMLTDHARGRAAEWGIPIPAIVAVMDHAKPRFAGGRCWDYRLTFEDTATRLDLRRWLGIAVVADDSDRVVTVFRIHAGAIRHRRAG